MKVIQINSECGRGSTGKIAVAISELLSANGVENYIFYSGNHKSEYSKGWMIAGKYSIRIHQVLSRLFGNQGFHSYFATKRLVKKLEKEEPDVILMHNLHGYYLHLEVLFDYLSKFKGKVIWTLHDCWAFTGHCTHFMIIGCEKWKIGCNHCPQRKKYPYSWFFDRSEKLYNTKKELFTNVKDLTIITPSEWLMKKVKESFLGEKKAAVIHNGINLDVFKPTQSDFRKKYNIHENKKIILGVAAVWGHSKGLDIFIKLAEVLDSTVYQIVLVGTDKEVDKLLPTNIISIHRTQNQRELAEIYTTANVFVNPTREDNYPSVNMEAIACGTPVITFNTGGCKESVAHNCGIVIENESFEDLVEAIEKMPFKDIEEIPCFNQDICFDKYLEIIFS